MADPVFRDDDASVYKNHILYFLPDDGNCARVVAAVEQHPLGEDVFMQDVRQLRQRPAWLDGVPILVRRKDGKAFKGQSVVAYLRSWQPEEDEFQPASSFSGGYASFEDGETSFAGERKFASLFTAGMFDGVEEEGGGASASRPGAVRAAAATNSAGPGGQALNEKQRRKQEAEVESSMRAQQLLDSRQQQDQRLQARQGGSSAPTARTVFTDDRFAGEGHSAAAASYPVQVAGAAQHQQHVQQAQYQGAPHAGQRAQGGQYGQQQYHGHGGGQQAYGGGERQQHGYGGAAGAGYGGGGGQGYGHRQGYGAPQGGAYAPPHGQQHAGPGGYSPHAYAAQPQPQYQPTHPPGYGQGYGPGAQGGQAYYPAQQHPAQHYGY